MSKKVKNRTATKEHTIVCSGYRVRFVYQRSAHIGGLGVQIITIDGATKSGQVMLRLGHRLLMAHWHKENWAYVPKESRDTTRISDKRRRSGSWD